MSSTAVATSRDVIVWRSQISATTQNILYQQGGTKQCIQARVGALAD